MTRPIRRAFISYFDKLTTSLAPSTNAMSVDPKFLGGLTISMLDGPAGVLRKEFDKLVAWVREEPRPVLDRAALRICGRVIEAADAGE